MDVVHTRANVSRVSFVREDLEQLSIRLAVFNAQNIGIQGSNGMEKVLELRVAEVGVDLGVISDTRGCQAEGLDSPGEVVLTLLTGAERQTLTKSRLINLDNLDTSSFKVNDLVTKSKGKLLSLNGLVNIITREGPAKASNRASKHALHRFLGDGSSILRLLDGHRGGAGDVTNNDWWAYATGSVTLNPGMCGKDVANKTLSKVLDHVITLGFTVDEDIEVKLLLDLNNILDLLLNELLVLLGSDLSLCEAVTLDTNLLGLRERTDGGGREERKVDRLGLGSVTSREGRLAVVHLTSDGSLPLLDLGVVSPLGRGTGLNGLSIGLESFADGGGAISDSLGNHDNFASLLDSEAEPIANFGVKKLLTLESMRDMEERAGSSDNDSVLAQLLDSELDLLDSSLEVGFPNVTTINNTGRKNLLGAKSANNSLQLLRVADEINVNAIEAVKGRKDIDVVDNVAKVGSKNKARSLVAKGTDLLIGRFESGLGLGRKVKDEDGLINLDILNTGLLELSQKLNVQGEELLKLVNRIGGLSTICLGKGQERNRSQNNGTSSDSSLLGLEELNDRLGLSSQLEDLVVLKSRLDIMVVGVKPFDHFLY